MRCWCCKKKLGRDGNCTIHTTRAGYQPAHVLCAEQVRVETYMRAQADAAGIEIPTPDRWPTDDEAAHES